MTAKILTSNCAYESGECVGGYHEIHDIRYLSGVEHLMATVKSIIDNNLMYGCADTVLESVEVSCDDDTVLDFCGKPSGYPFRYKDIPVYLYPYL